MRGDVFLLGREKKIIAVSQIRALSRRKLKEFLFTEFNLFRKVKSEINCLEWKQF